MTSPLTRQFLVAGSTHLAALSTGGMIAYPSVLLQQLKNKDTIIHLDLHNGSWIGSVHGIAGIPTILMPLLMQYKGCKFAFIISCILITFVWLIMYIAQNITTLIIGECFHGLGGNSLLAVSLLSVSEMVQPKYRSVCVSLHGLVQAFGITSVGIIGQYYILERSVHGIAGLPTILMPLLMQHRGRKLAFIISCILITLGWFIMYLAQSITTLIIGECFHGFGGNSLLAVSFLSISEMIQPKYRSVCLSMYSLVQSFGISTVGILGQYLHWKTVVLIMSFPALLAVPIGFMWPESPSWLAWKGKYEECQRTFERLRGTDEESRMELEAMVSKQHESKIKRSGVQWLREFRTTLVSRDFYLPALHNFVLINLLYWGGGMPVIIYSTDMFIKASGERNDQVKFFMDVFLFVGFCIASVLVRYCSAKKVLLCSMAGSSLLMMSASVVTYLQSIGTLPKDSELAVYCLAGFISLMSLGSSTFGFVISSEIMPVKHRGVGGCLFVIYTCICHSSSLKAYPYLCVYVNIWGVFLIYTIYMMLSIIVIWRYIPETRHKTLQEIEEYYVYGYFKGVNKPHEVDKDDAVVVPFIKH